MAAIEPLSRVDKGRLALVAAAATGIFVGSTIVATRFVIVQSTPAALAFLRYTIGLLCLLPPTFITARQRIARRDLMPIALLGIGQFGILVALLNYGAQYIPASRSALIFATMPLLTLLLSSLLGQERLTTSKLLSVLLSIGGVALALGTNLTVQIMGAEVRGVVAVLVSTLVGAICSIFYRPYLQRYPTLLVSSYAMAASVLFLAILVAPEGFFQQPLHFTWGGWIAVLFIGLSSGIGYYLWLWALHHATATNVTIYLALSPLTAALLGILFLGESLTLGLVVGIGCVIGGLWLAQR